MNESHPHNPKSKTTGRRAPLHRAARGRTSGNAPRARTLLAVVVLLACLPATALARRSVPRGFFGVMAGSELLTRPSLLPSETALMARSGVESTRTVFYWNVVQPYATWADVPAARRKQFSNPGSVPTDWHKLDPIVRATALNHLPLLPTVLLAPFWASDDATLPGVSILTPRNPSDYADFMTLLVRRYGPHGTFWKLNPTVPKRPVRSWQIWNEPHLPFYWRNTSAHPWPVTYTALLKSSWKAIHKADPGARVLLGGLTYSSWKILPLLYAAGARKWFDVAAIHPYSLVVGNIVKILELDRAAMTRHGDRSKPIDVTETSWPSAKGHATTTFGYNVTARGQATKLAAEFPLLAKARRRLGIQHVYWYTWLSSDRGKTDPFSYSGLRTFLHGKPVAKPALSAFRRAALTLEGR